MFVDTENEIFLLPPLSQTLHICCVRIEEEKNNFFRRRMITTEDIVVEYIQELGHEFCL